MSQEAPGIVIVEQGIDPVELRRLVDLYFGDMVKIVVDVRRRVAAVGGELHADAEQVLLEHGSAQADLWGANYYPGQGPDGCSECTALMIIGPFQGNGRMAIEDAGTRRAVREITHELIGRGEELAR